MRDCDVLPGLANAPVLTGNLWGSLEKQFVQSVRHYMRVTGEVDSFRATLAVAKPTGSGFKFSLKEVNTVWHLFERAKRGAWSLKANAAQTTRVLTFRERCCARSP